MTDDTIGSGAPTPEQRQGAAIVAAILLAVIRNDENSAADADALSYDLAALSYDASQLVGLTIQTTASIIKAFCESQDLDPVERMRLYLADIRGLPTNESDEPGEG